MDKPDKVILVATKTMMDNGMVKRFQDILKTHAIKHQLYEAMPSTNMPDIYEYALTTSENIQNEHSGAELILNATCGTKLMSQGFIEVMEDDAKIIYTDTQHNKLEYLGKNKKSIKLKSVLNIEDYFQANGAKYHQSLNDKENFEKDIAARKAITKYIAQNSEILQSLIRNLNGLVHGSVKEKGALRKINRREYELSRPTQYLKKQPQGERQELLKMLTKNKFIKWKNGEKSKEITFLGINKALYIAGGWLEEYVYHIVKDEKPDHVKSGVKISWMQSTKTHNELDLVAVHNNRMLIIECKTSTFGGLLKEKDANILYKIDSLGEDLKGLYGKVWLVSAQNTKPEMRDRAKDRNIKIIETSNLKNLRQEIKNWMQ
jgi:cell division protein FtsB